MGYLEESLVPGEQVVMKAKVHWAMLLDPTVALAFIGYITWVISNALKVDIPPLYIRSYFLTGLIVLVRFFALRASTELAVTSTRIIAKTGVWKHGSLEIMLPRVESIKVNQSLIGRIFKYGNLTVKESGGKRRIFEGIERPNELRSKINQMKEGS